MSLPNYCCPDYNEIDTDIIENVDDYTGVDEWYAVYTIQLGELVQSGVFDWSSPMLDWSSAKYDDDQYTRVCAYFIERFRFREISIIPYYEWATMLRRKLVYELMPKYKTLYERVASGVNPLTDKDEYHKERNITSDYPETQLSGNSDYISMGTDREYETVIEGNTVEMLINYHEKYHGVDELLLDELESMFISLYTVNVNGY